VLASVANSRTGDVLGGSGGDTAALPNALTEGFQVAFVVGALLAALGLVLTLVLIRTREPGPIVDATRLERS
jgi:hypothetical protein